VRFPLAGDRRVIPLVATDRTEDFLLDVTRSRIDLGKVTYQNRGRAVVVLLQLDINGPSHHNPDGIQIACPHLHIYREGFGDKWAFPLPEGKFANLDEITQILSDFMDECKATARPALQAGFF
jgi:hypothetical protein